MVSRAEGNAAKRASILSPGEWAKWRGSRHAKVIRFIQTFCVPVKGYGAGKPLVLAPFQKDWLEEVHAPGISSAAMQLPRGNGKSTLLAALALAALFMEDETGAPSIPMVATTINQAVRTVYGVAEAMRDNHPALRDRSSVFSAIGTQKIKVPYNHGEMFPVSNDPDGLQGLDPSLGVCDELGFIPIESWDSLLLATGKRPRSLVVGIGTPGFDHESTLWHLRERVRSGADLPGFRFTEYAADPGCDLLDEKNWREANPALKQGYMNADALRMAVALSPESHFRIFRLGQWVEGVESWLGEDGRKTWRNLEDPWSMEAGAPTWVGMDLGLKRDTTAVVWTQRRDDGRWHCKAKIWFPHPDGRLDIAQIMQFVRELSAMYELRDVAYDPRHFELAAEQLRDEGLPMREFPQSLERMSPAVGDAYEAIKRAEISHDGDELFEAQVLAATIRPNERGFTIEKGNQSGDRRYDACVAMVLALDGAMAPDRSAEFFALMRRHEALGALVAGIGLLTAGLVWLVGPYGLLGVGAALVALAVFFFDVKEE